MKLGIVGLGGVSRAYLEGIRTLEDAEFLAGCDLDEGRLKEKTEKYHIPHDFTSFDDLLKIDEIEGVVVSTTAPFHHDLSIQALQAGKHVLCEKPMALTIEDAQEMYQESERTGKLLMVDFSKRFCPLVMEAKKWLEEGTIGEITNIRYLSATGGPYHRTAYPVKERGADFDHSVHGIDLVRHLAGGLKEVKGWIEKFPNGESAALAMVNCRFKSGAFGLVESSLISGMSGNYYTRVEIHGSQGTIIVDHGDALTVRLAHRDDQTPDFTAWRIKSFMERRNITEFANALRNFVGAIKGEEEPLTSAYDGLKTIEVVFAMQEGKWVAIDDQL